jgi:hypothetical protein
MKARGLMLGCAAALAAACGGGTGGEQAADTTQAVAPVAPAEALPPDVQLAINVERGIGADPTKADSILTAYGLTRDGLDSLMYAIAADSAKAAAFSAARR